MREIQIILNMFFRKCPKFVRSLSEVSDKYLELRK